MTQYFEQHTNSAPIYRQKLRRILDKNFDFQRLIGAYEEETFLEKINLYRALTQEEVKEFNEALANKDLNEAVKELADIFVVASVYGDLYSSNTMLGYIRDVPNAAGIHQLVIADKNWSGQAEINTIEYIFDCATMMSRSFNFDFLPYLEAVIDNNFDKLPLVESVEDPEKDAKAIEEGSNGRYKRVTFEEVIDLLGNKRYKFIDINGKIMKPVGYETVKFDIK